MCSKIVIVDELTGEITNVMQTIGELKKLGIDVIFREHSDFKSGSSDDSCLCGVDIEATAKHNGFMCALKNNVYTFVFNDEDLVDDDDECIGDCDLCDIDCEVREGFDDYCCEFCGEEGCEGECSYCDLCGDPDCDGTCEEYDESDDAEEEEGIEYSEWSPVQWPDSGNWFVADSQGKTVCLFNNENVDTKEAAELVAIAPEMLNIIQRYYTGKNDNIDAAIAKNFLKKFKMID